MLRIEKEILIEFIINLIDLINPVVSIEEFYQSGRFRSDQHH